LGQICTSWAKDGDRVADPYREETFSCIGKQDGRFLLHPGSTYGGFRFRADLNFDGLEDIILERNDEVPCGTSGCPASIYLKQPDGIFVTKEFWLHPLAVSLSRVATGEGTLSVYSRISGGEGSIGRYRVTKDSVLDTGAVPYRGDIPADQRLYDSLFSGASSLKPEFATCVNGAIQWSRDYR